MLTVLIGAAFTAVGCGGAPRTVAAAGASPGVTSGIPVGPIPGVAEQPALPANPYSNNSVAQLEGRHLFVHYNCSGCHGGHAGGGMGPSLRDPAWIYGGEDAHIFASITEGRAHGMPAWGGKIPREQVWELVAYLKSLRTPQEPEPPR